MAQKAREVALDAVDDPAVRVVDALENRIHNKAAVSNIGAHDQQGAAASCLDQGLVAV